MGVLLSLVAALCYGTSDFAAGVGGRRGDSTAVAAIAQPIALLASLIAVAVVPMAPTFGTLAWGVVAGIGSGVGTLALYRGLAVARMSVVAPLSGVVTAAVPAVTGALLGDTLSPLTWVGVGIAVPAALLVSLQSAAVPAGGSAGGRRITAGSADAARPAGAAAAARPAGAAALTGAGGADAAASAATERRGGVGYGILAGLGFAVLFIALSRAGTHAGAWPLVPTQLVSVIVILIVAVAGRRAPRDAWRRSLRPGLLCGVLSGVASLAYLAATGFGQLAVVAVITALYPAATVLLARIIEKEHWGRLQLVGLAAAALAVALTAIG